MTYYNADKITQSSKQKNGKVFLSLAAIFVLLTLSVFYLVQVNRLIARNFELRNFQNILGKSQQENQSLSVSVTQLRSIANLQEVAKSLNLTVIEKPKYLKAALGFFALSD